MHDHDPTVRSRELGRLLSEELATIGMTQFALARELGWSPSMVSRMISGRRPVSAELMSGVLGVLRVTGEKRRYAMSISRSVTESGWLRELGDGLPERSDIMATLEGSATAMVVFEPNFVPDVLQSAEYMTALMETGAAIPADEIDARVKARLVRHGEVLDREGPADLLFFIDEYALCRTGTDRDVMSIQVHHLLRMAVRPRITIRVIPEITGFHRGAKGSFRIATFEDGNPVVCVENETSIVFLERDETITAYMGIVSELSRVALDEPQTRTWLANLATRLSAQQGDGDTPRMVGTFELDEDRDDQQEAD